MSLVDAIVRNGAVTLEQFRNVFGQISEVKARLDALEGKADADRIATLEARLARMEAPVSDEEVRAFRHVYALHSGRVSETYKAALTAFLAGRKGL